MNIQWVGSPNFTKGRAGKPIQYIVIHHMAGTIEAADAVFQDHARNTSAHYGVAHDGRVHQYVLETDTAYQAGVYDINQRSIGIEHEDLNADNYTDLEYGTSAALIRDICKRYNLPINANTIRPHRAFTPTACPGSLDLSRLIRLANEGDSMGATKEWLIVEYRLAFPNRPDNPDWVTNNIGRDYNDVVQDLRDDASRQAYITDLVNHAAAYENQAVPNVIINGTTYVPK